MGNFSCTSGTVFATLDPEYLDMSGRARLGSAPRTPHRDRLCQIWVHRDQGISVTFYILLARTDGTIVNGSALALALVLYLDAP